MVASQTFPVDLAMVSDTLVLYLLSRVSIPRGVWILLGHLGHVRAWLPRASHYTIRPREPFLRALVCHLNALVCHAGAGLSCLVVAKGSCAGAGWLSESGMA